MDFFERWFGLAPDDGSGLTEALWTGAIVLVAFAIMYCRRIGAWLGLRSSRRG